MYQGRADAVITRHGRSRRLAVPAKSSKIKDVMRKGKASATTIAHVNYAAVEYELYIPALVFHHPATQALIRKLQKVEPAATVSKGLQGIWRGQKEVTHVYRMILRISRFHRRSVRATLQNEIGNLMQVLSQSKKARQQIVLFTEREIHVCMSSL